MEYMGDDYLCTYAERMNGRTSYERKSIQFDFEISSGRCKL